RLRLGSELGRQVVVVDDRVVLGLDVRQPDAGVVLGPGRSRARARPPRFEGLAWHRDHRVEQDEKINSAPGADDRRGEATDRRGDREDTSRFTVCVDKSIRVLRPAGLVVLGWQPTRNRMVATGTHLGDEPMPLPWVAPPPGISAYVAIALS